MPGEQCLVAWGVLSQSHFSGWVFNCQYGSKWLSLRKARGAGEGCMVDGKVRLVIAAVAVLAGVSQGQPRNAAVQSPRQAMVEMFSGGEAPFKKHLTLEMQRKLQEVMKGPSSN